MRGSSLRERERGLTLIELLVAMSLLAITLTLVTTLFVSLSQTFTRQEAQHDSSGQASIGMRNIGQAIRAGADVPQGTGADLSAFVAAGYESLTMHAFFDPESSPLVPTRLNLAVNGNRELVETRRQGRLVSDAWVFDRTPRERVIARDIVTGGAADPLFTYVLGDGTRLARELTATERVQVVAVDVSLSVQTVAGRSAPVQITRTVTLPNLDVTTETD